MWTTAPRCPSAQCARGYSFGHCVTMSTAGVGWGVVVSIRLWPPVENRLLFPHLLGRRGLAYLLANLQLIWITGRSGGVSMCQPTLNPSMQTRGPSMAASNGGHSPLCGKRLRVCGVYHREVWRAQHTWLSRNDVICARCMLETFNHVPATDHNF